jgi:hypothetical protein
MMFYCLPKLARKKRANRTLVVQGAALTAIIGWILIFNACSGASAPGANSVGTTTSGTSATGNLTITPRCLKRPLARLIAEA